MRTVIVIALCASAAMACTDQTPTTNDGGMDASPQDGSPDTGGQDAATDHICIFDKDNFDNGCVFGM